MQKVTLHPMGLSKIAIVCQLWRAERFPASYHWFFNSFWKLGNFLHQKITSSINSKTTVASWPSWLGLFVGFCFFSGGSVGPPLVSGVRGRGAARGCPLGKTEHRGEPTATPPFRALALRGPISSSTWSSYLMTGLLGYVGCCARTQTWNILIYTYTIRRDAITKPRFGGLL